MDRFDDSGNIAANECADQLRILDEMHQRTLGQVEQALKQRDALRADLAAVAAVVEQQAAQLAAAGSELDHASVPSGGEVTIANRIEMLADERDTLRAQLTDGQAAHALDLEVFKSGAEQQAKVIEGLRAEIALYTAHLDETDALSVESVMRYSERRIREADEASVEAEQQVTRLDVRTRMAEAVRDSMAARVAELCEAVRAERVAHAAYDEDGGDELLFTWANARQLTDAMVAKHAGAGVKQ